MNERNTQVLDSRVRIEVFLGSSTRTLHELAGMEKGTVIELDRLITEPLEIRVGDAVIGLGEVVTVGDSLGVRVIEMKGAPE